MVILDLIRGVAFLLFVLCACVAFGSWAVMTRRINPFSKTGQTIRRLTDPVLDPVEHWLRKRGGNPRNAGWWILGGSVVGGIVLITVTEWLIVQWARMAMASSAGPRGVFRLVVYYAGQILVLALIARVIGSWFGIGRFNRWMRHAYRLTDWIVEPLRKIVPPMGRIDITPLIAWFLVQIVMSLILRIL